MTERGARPFGDTGDPPPPGGGQATMRLEPPGSTTPAAGRGEALLGRFLAAAGVGVVLFIAGLALDAWLHARDPALAAREGLFSLGNPGHAMFLAGVLLTAGGVLGAGWVLLERRPAAGRTPAGGGAAGGTPRGALLGVAVVAVVGLTAVAGWASSSGDGHGHGGSAAQADHAAGGDPMDGHAAGKGGKGGKGGKHRHQRLAPVAEATAEQRAAAQALLDASIAAAARWRDPAAARREGYRVNLGKLTSGETRFLHAGNRGLRADGGTLDPQHPESVIYGKGPDGTPVLVGVLYVAPPGQRGPTPGGPITSWHTHSGCVDLATGKRQPLPEQAGGTCPDGLEPRNGPEMLHVWFTDRLETAFARRAPVQALLAWQRTHGGAGTG